MTNEPTPTPETDAKLASDPHPPSDWPEYARALEIQRNAVRAERDEHIARNNDSLLALHLTTAERDEALARLEEWRFHETSWGTDAASVRKHIKALTAERDAARDELATVNAERAEARGLRREMIKAQDERAALRTALDALRNPAGATIADGGEWTREEAIEMHRRKAEALLKVTAERDALRAALEGIAEYGVLSSDGSTRCARLIYLAKQALNTPAQ